VTARSPRPCGRQHEEQRAITPVLGRSSRAFKPVHNRRALTVTDAPFPLGLASLGDDHFQHSTDRIPQLRTIKDTTVPLGRLLAFRLSDLSQPIVIEVIHRPGRPPELTRFDAARSKVARGMVGDDGIEPLSSKARGGRGIMELPGEPGGRISIPPPLHRPSACQKTSLV